MSKQSAAALRTAADLIDTQLRSIPMKNEAVTVRQRGQAAEVAVPMQQRAWSRFLGHFLKLSKQKSVELDELGTEIYEMCDGVNTVEDIIDSHQQRWKLSFFESRAMVLQFMKQMMRRNLIVIVAPKGK